MSNLTVQKLDDLILAARDVHATIIRDDSDDIELKALNLLVDLMNLKTGVGGDQKSRLTTPASSQKSAESITPESAVAATDDETEHAKNKIPQWKGNHIG